MPSVAFGNSLSARVSAVGDRVHTLTPLLAAAQALVAAGRVDERVAQRVLAGDGGLGLGDLGRVDAGRGRRGGVQLGLNSDERARLRLALAEREMPRTRQRRVRAVAAGIHVVVESHGRIDGPLGDAVIRAVLVDGA